MFYVFQMNDGRWHVDAYTRAPLYVRQMAHDVPGSETKAEAEAHRARLQAELNYAEDLARQPFSGCIIRAPWSQLSDQARAPWIATA